MSQEVRNLIVTCMSARLNSAGHEPRYQRVAYEFEGQEVDRLTLSLRTNEPRFSPGARYTLTIEDLP